VNAIAFGFFAKELLTAQKTICVYYLKTTAVVASVVYFIVSAFVASEFFFQIERFAYSFFVPTG
jgi:hypothetical protein